jgi:hypothetical protein
MTHADNVLFVKSKVLIGINCIFAEINIDSKGMTKALYFCFVAYLYSSIFSLGLMYTKTETTKI